MLLNYQIKKIYKICKGLFYILITLLNSLNKKQAID